MRYLGGWRLRRQSPCSPATLLTTCTADGPASVTVYSIRNPDHHEPIAKALAGGQIAAFYVGLFGIGQAIRPAWLGHDDAETYWRVKAGRPRWAKVPLLSKPSQALRLIDFRLVHPAFRHLARREAFERLWTGHGAPLHVIAPLRQPLRFLDPALVTVQADLLHQAVGEVERQERVIAPATACFFWVEDPMWDAVVTLAGLYGPPRASFGVSSLNDHGEQPPYTMAELRTFAGERRLLPFDLVISDELYERSGAFSSHTQVRLPLVGEPPELIVVRQGCVSAEWLAESTGYPVRVLASASIASRQPGLTDRDLRARLELFRAWRNRDTGG